MNPRALIAVKAAITVIAFIIVGYRVDLTKVSQTLSGFPTGWIPAIVGLLALGLIVSTLKWKVVLDTLGQTVSVSRLAGLFWIGLFFNTFLPGRTGGDIFRALGLPKSASSRSRAVTSVIIDRGMNLVALVLIASVATFLDDRIPHSVVSAVRLFAGGVLLTAVVGFRLRRRLLNALPERATAKLYPLLGASWGLRDLVLAATLAVTFQVTMVLINVCVARALEIPIGMTALFVAIPLTALVTAIPLSINGVGVREAAYATLLAYLGASPEHGVALSIAATAAMIGWSVFGGLVFVAMTHKNKQIPRRQLSFTGASR